VKTSKDAYVQNLCYDWFFFTGCDNYKGVPKQFFPGLPQGPSMSNELIDLE